MRTIQVIVDRKKEGIDCTEQESAEIKKWLKELRMVGEQTLEAEIQNLFHLEYDEYLRGIESKIWTMGKSRETILVTTNVVYHFTDTNKFYNALVFDDVDSANEFMTNNKEWSVLTEKEGKVILAKSSDLGKNKNEEVKLGK